MNRTKKFLCKLLFFQPNDIHARVDLIKYNRIQRDAYAVLRLTIYLSQLTLKGQGHLM